ncbi:RNA-directed DNA polymerase, eukaryota [Tanacetum coccineum]
MESYKWSSKFHRGLKQGDPLSPYLFILVMESLHLSVTRVVNEGVFKGIRLHESLSLSHLFYADDALFIGEWSDGNCVVIISFSNVFILLRFRINISKSQIMGVGVHQSSVEAMADSIGCSTMPNKFRYLGVMVGEHMSRHKSWDEVVVKLKTRLSKWKAKTLSIGGRLTLLKSVLGASPLYMMSIFKVPKGVLKIMESIRSKFFKGAEASENKISWMAWNKILTSKEKGGLGVSSFHALNRALLLKWLWRFVSQDGSLWFRVIKAVYGPSLGSHSSRSASIWSTILREVHVLKNNGFDFLSYCSKRVGDGNSTRFWLESWKGDKPFCVAFPRMFGLELNREISVAAKLAAPLEESFRRPVRGGMEQHQFSELNSIYGSVSLSSCSDRWVCSLSSDGRFSVKEVRNAIDDLYLPSHSVPTRWVKVIPIKINIFAWRARRNCLPTRINLIQRGVSLDSSSCPICNSGEEDVDHVFFGCNLAQVVSRRLCRWWDLDWQNWSSFSEWFAWFNSIRLSSKVKSLLEGVFYVAWWFIWRMRNRTIFDANPPFGVR